VDSHNRTPVSPTLHVQRRVGISFQIIAFFSFKFFLDILLLLWYTSPRINLHLSAGACSRFYFSAAEPIFSLCQRQTNQKSFSLESIIYEMQYCTSLFFDIHANCVGGGGCPFISPRARREVASRVDNLLPSADSINLHRGETFRGNPTPRWHPMKLAYFEVFSRISRRHDASRLVLTRLRPNISALNSAPSGPWMGALWPKKPGNTAAATHVKVRRISIAASFPQNAILNPSRIALASTVRHRAEKVSSLASGSPRPRRFPPNNSFFTNSGR